MKLPESPLVLVFILCLIPALSKGSINDERKTYIVYMGEVGEAEEALKDSHHKLLASAIGDEQLARKSRIHSYGKSFNALAAKLLPHEAEKISREEGVVSVFPSRIRKLHTTRSWNFLGMPLGSTKRNIMEESHIIVGILDTGIYPKAPSFNDKGYGPPPARWRGKCIKGANFTGCNKKIIGAKYFNLDHIEPATLSPIDEDGHGTHTSSTIVGSPVAGASLYGIGKGTAHGGVPSARIAMYKVCWGIGCTDVDLLAGFDHAIADGVDLISVSIGGPSSDFFEDSIAIGSFHAMKKGILTSCSAGNSGPYLKTVENTAPWIMTVAASALDRQFITNVVLGNGKKLMGYGINTFSLKKKMYSLTSGSKAVNASSTTGTPSECDYGTLDENKVKGKIVYCRSLYGPDYTIGQYGGKGVIMWLDMLLDYSMETLMPGVWVYTKEATIVDTYINTTKNPQAVIHKTTNVTRRAPFVASFSSRGPQIISRHILKPDLTAPGVDILAAYSKLASITGDDSDKRFDVFNIISGTSMACPHAAAAAAYVKSFHPRWSAAAIRSALMTTATPMKIVGKDAELGSGAGQIDPTKALHPGLVYDLSLSSYISFLCREGYNSTTLALLMGGKKKFDCSKIKPVPGTDGLNYPSMHTQLPKGTSSISAVFHRTVTHVGYGKSVYVAKVTAPKGLSVTVVPDTLTFDRASETRQFKVVLKGGMPSGTQILSALLEWTDSRHSAKSPIVVFKDSE